MAAPATVDEFLDLIRKSGVADEKRLDAYLVKSRAGLPTEPGQAAKVLIENGLLTDFQSENILAGKWKRFSIGKYKILEKLGSGGMGQVFLCEHKLMRRRVAVKVLPPAKIKDSSALERFYREARAVAALDHPNIVHAYDVDQDADLHFIVMEFVDGINFQDLIKKVGTLDVARACHYIRQAALALQHAHEAGLVHRDIKPGNILVDRTGVVKILDMGLARFFHDEDDILTKKYDENVLGTADYLSPEQALDSHTVDIRADIYSLGATFYFLLTGRAPFEGANAAQKLLMHQMREPKAIAEYRKDVPAEVAAIVKKMMAKDPAQRYATPDDLAEALAPLTSAVLSPPLEAEMPKLSIAASGKPASDGPVTAVTTNNAPASLLSPPVAPKAAPRPATPRPAPAAIVAAPVARSVPQAAPAQTQEEERWEEIAHDTDNPAAKADTTPQSGRSSPKSKKKLKPTRSYLTLVIALLVLLVVVPVIAVAAIGLAVYFFYTPPPPPVAPSGPPKFEISKQPNRPQAFRTIQLALREAKIGSIIELNDPVHEENLIIEPARGRTEVTIQAAPGKEVLWRSAKSDPDTPLLKTYKAGGFKLKGMGIILDGTLDAKSRLNELIMITGDSPGLLIDDVQMKSFARSAILVMNSTGAPAQPIWLHRMTATIEKTEKPRAVIFLDANPKMNPSINDHIKITDCEFRGIDAKKAIGFKDKSVLGGNVTWPGR